MEINNTPNLTIKSYNIMTCDLCNYKCSNIIELQKHLDSINHKGVNGNEIKLNKPAIQYTVLNFRISAGLNSMNIFSIKK